MAKDRSVYQQQLAVTKTNVYEFQNHLFFAQNIEQVREYLAEVPLYADEEENILLLKEVSTDKYIIVKAKDVVETEAGFVLGVVKENVHLPTTSFYHTREEAENVVSKF